MIDERRVKTLHDVPAMSGAVVYVMAREQRVHDNWALLYAQERAQALGVPLLVLFVVGPMFASGSKRHNEWMVASLQDVERELATLKIPFFVRCGPWADTVVEFVHKEATGELVLDFNPMEPVASWRQRLASLVSVRVNMVDARNIVPCWYASPKTEFAAYTFRPKINRLLPEFLCEFPPVELAAHAYTQTVPAVDWEEIRQFRQVDDTVVPTSFEPGEQAGKQALQSFLDNRLNGYSTLRNDPTVHGVSDLSVYLRWGNLSAQRVALLVASSQTPRTDREAYLEELIVRRELSDNFVYYTNEPTKLSGAHAWAQTTLAEHSGDTREFIYSYEQFENAQTHDPLWNAMQIQMVTEGKMHGWCRMYWAKKILEWTNNPQEAIDIALTLNDRFELDGRDSNGITGVMWSIAGVHDRAWAERPVFGKIRYMNFNGAKRKFEVAKYIARYSKEPSLFNE